jgi:hypothetical protein
VIYWYLIKNNVDGKKKIYEDDEQERKVKKPVDY